VKQRHKQEFLTSGAGENGKAPSKNQGAGEAGGRKLTRPRAAHPAIHIEREPSTVTKRPEAVDEVQRERDTPSRDLHDRLPFANQKTLDRWFWTFSKSRGGGHTQVVKRRARAGADTLRWEGEPTPKAATSLLRGEKGGAIRDEKTENLEGESSRRTRQVNYPPWGAKSRAKRPSLRGQTGTHQSASPREGSHQNGGEL